MKDEELGKNSFWKIIFVTKMKKGVILIGHTSYSYFMDILANNSANEVALVKLCGCHGHICLKKKNRVADNMNCSVKQKRNVSHLKGQATVYLTVLVLMGVHE